MGEAPALFRGNQRPEAAGVMAPDSDTPPAFAMGRQTSLSARCSDALNQYFRLSSQLACCASAANSFVSDLFCQTFACPLIVTACLA